MTAPLHGFEKLNYWKLASAVSVLPKIRVPTLLLNARNDPFLPEQVLSEIGDVPSNLLLEFPSQGSHVGFPGRGEWLVRRILDFLSLPDS